MVKTMRADLDVFKLIYTDEIADILEFLLKQGGNVMIDNIDLRCFSGTPFAQSSQLKNKKMSD